MNTWNLPEIPAEADSFAITRSRDAVTWDGQTYENVGAPGGAESVRKVLATAHRLQTVSPLNRSGFAPYAVVEIADDAGNPIDGLAFAIPDHQAYLWWASQMPLTPIITAWEDDVVATLPEDPRVTLLLTSEAATVAADLLCEGALLTDQLLSGRHRLLTAQVIDALRRLTGYAEHDREHSSGHAHT